MADHRINAALEHRNPGFHFATWTRSHIMTANGVNHA
jgi:hypothetical protein